MDAVFPPEMSDSDDSEIATGHDAPVRTTNASLSIWSNYIPL